jgi:A/G-specific adenine glycosylase
MVKGGALSNFRKQLLAWFAQSQRELPWRRDKNAYRVWLSEIMLQQTRVAAAIPYYKRFLQRFPNVQSLAEAPEEAVLRLWSGLGYYSRARNLQKAARQIVGQHGGQFPREREAALRLAGIGKYTAAAILSIAYGEKLAVLDGNVARVLARIEAIRGDLREAGRWNGLQERADALLDSAAPGDWNQAMMELGATVCTPRSPQCLLCPVTDFCEARKEGIAELLPEKRKKRATVRVRLAAGVLLDATGRTLLVPPPDRNTQRKNDADDVSSLISKLWHFPMVLVKGDAEASLQQSLRSLTKAGELKSAAFEQLADVRHAVTYRDVRVAPFLVVVQRLPQIEGAKILALGTIDEVPISNLTRKIAQRSAASKAIKTPRRNR